jgi:hypothetical protein
VSGPGSRFAEAVAAAVERSAPGALGEVAELAGLSGGGDRTPAQVLRGWFEATLDETVLSDGEFQVKSALRMSLGEVTELGVPADVAKQTEAVLRGGWLTAGEWGLDRVSYVRLLMLRGEAEQRLGDGIEQLVATTLANRLRIRLIIAQQGGEESITTAAFGDPARPVVLLVGGQELPYRIGVPEQPAGTS